jgi:hypothetical protein
MEVRQADARMVPPDAAVSGLNMKLLQVYSRSIRTLFECLTNEKGRSDAKNTFM